MQGLSFTDDNLYSVGFLMVVFSGNVDVMILAAELNQNYSLKS